MAYCNHYSCQRRFAVVVLVLEDIGQARLQEDIGLGRCMADIVDLDRQQDIVDRLGYIGLDRQDIVPILHIGSLEDILGRTRARSSLALLRLVPKGLLVVALERCPSRNS